MSDRETFDFDDWSAPARPRGAAVRLNSTMSSNVAELQRALESLIDGSTATDAPRRGATLLRFQQRS